MFNAPVRTAIGVTVGIQFSESAKRLVPAQAGDQSDLVVMLASAFYLMWGGRPSAGMTGDVLDGIAIGLAASSAQNLVKLPF